MRRANGTGSVVNLGENRRNPFAVRVSYLDEHSHIRQKYLSYHKSVREAQAALEAFNASRAAGAAPAPDALSVTVQGVYDLWSARKYSKSGAASISSYKASWARLAPLCGLKMRDVTIDRLQAIIDQDEAAGLSKSSINNDCVLMKALFRFAMERDIVAKDYSDFIQIPTVDAKFEKGSFTDIQMRKLEQMAADGFPWADTVLMLCYTGFRITEFLSLTPFSYDTAGDYLRGGIKTEAGKNRIVPVHPKIKPYLIKWIAMGGDRIICDDIGKPIAAWRYRSRLFQPVVTALGLTQATPHWCRHTFATRLHATGVAELEQKRLMGHASMDVTEHYTHTDMAQLAAAIMKLA